MWSKLLDTFLMHLFREGELSVTYPDGVVRRYGDGEGLHAGIVLNDPDLPRKIIISPDLGIGEGYMDGRLSFENDDLHAFLGLAIHNITQQGQPWFRKPFVWRRRLARYLNQFNPATRSRSNVAHHYDLSAELYDLFLDEDRQYSCAYFSNPDMSLEDAQTAKKAHIANKLLIKPGMRVLDIGCGWGGMALTLARDYGAEVLGVTLSQEQHALATERAKAAGLADKVQFKLMDYRDVQGQFDRVVSVGMFEHVGVPHYAAYFKTLRALLKEDGIALIHTIGRCDAPGFTSPWIAKYIFPGGYIPAMSEALKPIEQNDMFTTDVEIWRLHYAETLRHWYDRFTANQDRARTLYDDRFCRMWRYYLVACEQSFRYGRQAVFQFQLAPEQDSVPLTRDYLYAENAGGLRHAAE